MKRLPISIRLILLAPAALLWGCAVSTGTAPPTTASASIVIAKTAAEERVETPIPSDSLYPLMAAEFALRNRDLALGLRLLTEQCLILTDPAIARRALQLAEFVNNDEVALIAAIRLAALDPTDAAASATAMSLLIRTGATDQAIAYASKAKAGGARINAPALMQGFDALEPTRQEAIIRGIESLAEAYPNDLDIAIAQSLLYRQLKRYNDAGTALAPVFRNNANDERALVLWTQIQLDSADSTPFERIGRAVERQPDNENLRLQYARLLAANERFDEARAQFLALKNTSPRNGDYLFSLALIDFEQQQFDAAKSSLQALIALQQRPDEAWYYVGRIEEQTGNRGASVEAYGHVGPSREFIDAHRRAASQLMTTNDPRDIDEFFSAARRKNNDQAERLFLLEAETLKEAQLRSRAMAAFDAGVTAYPTSMPLLYGRAMLRENQGDFAGMETDLRTILIYDPNNATTLNALGYALTNSTDRYVEAANLIEKALALSPGDAAILDSLGWVYYKLGRLKEARQLLTEAYDILPEPEVAAHLGETLWALGDREEAQRIWHRVLRVDPQNTYVRDTLDRLGAHDL